MTETKCNAKTLQDRSQRSVLHDVGFVQKYSRRQLEKVRWTVGNYLVDYSVKRKDGEKWVENPTKRFIHEIYDTVAEPIRTGHWRAPRLGHDRTAYVIGLYGTGLWYIHTLMEQNLGERSTYIRRRIRLHAGPTSMIYVGHATMKHVSRGQRLPAVTSRILEAVSSGFADLIFLYRHPLDSLLTNWIWWRGYIREKRMIGSITEEYKNLDDFCLDLEQDFAGFKAFAEGNPDFYAAVPGPRFLSFSEFVEETELYRRSATLALRLEDFKIDPLKEFSKIAEVMSVDIDLSRFHGPLPRTKPHRYLAVTEKVPRFRDFIGGLNAETKRKIDDMELHANDIKR
jgi:hypothetical protein